MGLKIKIEPGPWCLTRHHFVLTRSQNKQAVEPADNRRPEDRPIVTQPQPEGDNSNKPQPQDADSNNIPTTSTDTGETNIALITGNLRENANQLMAEKVNLHKKENREAHKTDEYEIEQLILRRGQAFDVTVTFNRDYNSDTDVITVQFVTGKNPQQNKGGIVRVQIRDALVLSKWGMQVKEANENTLRLSIMSSAQAAIGYYDVMVETKSKDSGVESLYRHKHEEQICILFNAWCLDDIVYMEHNEDLDLDPAEYVLKENGHLWRGSWKRISKIPWNFGQFEDVALHCALWLLSEKANLSSKAMSNVIHVARTMTYMVNSADLGGVLKGSWEATFPEGTAPWEWSGSIAILEEFWKTKKVVKYGQCWVFSGVLTSLLRALGIPTRSVTNFESAHDTEKSLTVDYFFDAEGRPFQPDPYNEDSVWNFHVWNECWFKRLDLPDGHDGWQAVDGTPQEFSGGFYQCGPASVNAIKNGEVYLHYDTNFIFSEVNADKVYWETDPSGEIRVIQIDHHSVGKSISTETPGKVAERRDLTSHYKHTEGSEEERKVVEFVHRFSTRQDLQIYGPAERDITSRLDVVDEVKIGEPFKATAIVKNECNEKRTITGHLTAILVFYTGRTARTLKEAEDTFILEPGKEKSVMLDISFPELLAKSIADCSIKVFLKGSVKETDQRFAVQDVVEFMKPELNVTLSIADYKMKLNEEVTVTVSLTNPLPTDLTNGKFHFEFNLMKPRTLVVDCKGPVRVDEKKEITVTFLAVKRNGYRNLSVNFNSDEVHGVVGESFVIVS